MFERSKPGETTVRFILRYSSLLNHILLTESDLPLLGTPLIQTLLSTPGERHVDDVHSFFLFIFSIGTLEMIAGAYIFKWPILLSGPKIVVIIIFQLSDKLLLFFSASNRRNYLWPNVFTFRKKVLSDFLFFLKKIATSSFL